MSKYGVHFQTDFSKTSKNKIIKDYNLFADDEILLAAWISDKETSVYNRKGFVITQRGLSWNYPAMAESSESESKERAPRDTNFIEKENVTFLGAMVNSPDTAKRTDGKSEIQIRTSGTVYIFGFDSGIKYDRIVLLEKAISSYFSDCLDLNEFEKQDESYTLKMTVLSSKDFFSCVSDFVKEQIENLKTGVGKGSEKIKSAKIKNKIVYSVNTTGAFFRHIIDFVTDIILMLAVLLFVKSDLLAADFFNGGLPTEVELNFSIFAYNPFNLPSENLNLRNVAFIVFTLIFFIMKIFISLSCRKNRKAITALLLMMLFADFFLMPEKFLLFIIFFFMILLALQFSMGFSAKIVAIKTVLFVLISFIINMLLYIVLYTDKFMYAIETLADMFVLRVNW